MVKEEGGPGTFIITWEMFIKHERWKPGEQMKQGYRNFLYVSI